MRVLNAGCGAEPLPQWFDNIGGEWRETRYDIDPNNSPDYVGSITDICVFGDDEFDAVSCSHTLEHLYPHDVPKALGEFHRVLRPGGFLAILVPDLEDVRPNEEPLYQNMIGPVTGLDLIYGLRVCVAESLYMAHHTGFTSATLRASFEGAGFAPDHIGVKRMMMFNLLGVAIK